MQNPQDSICPWTHQRLQLFQSVSYLAPTGSSRQGDSRINAIVLSTGSTRCWSGCRPTYSAASSSPVPICLCLRVHVFRGERFSKDLYSGRLAPEACVHICLSRPNETSSVFECVYVWEFCSSAWLEVLGTQRRLQSLFLCAAKKVISHYGAILLCTIGWDIYVCV